VMSCMQTWERTLLCRGCLACFFNFFQKKSLKTLWFEGLRVGFLFTWRNLKSNFCKQRTPIGNVSSFFWQSPPRAPSLQCLQIGSAKFDLAQKAIRSASLFF
jgi:hypothetical protein